LLPYSVSRWSVRRVNQADDQAAVFYCHPWEIDPEQPKVMQANLKARFRHYVNQRQLLGKLNRLLDDFHWGTVRDVIYARQ
jgi:predicted alpha/beta-fold hydrolase